MKDGPDLNHGNKRNGATELRWLMLGTAAAYYVIFVLVLWDDFMPYVPERIMGYAVIVSTIAASSWLYGWLSGREFEAGRKQ